jgi:hypothetical protein
MIARVTIAALLLFALALAASCGSESPTETVVRVDAEAESRRRATSIHVTVWSEDGAVRFDEALPLVGENPLELPATVPLVPKAGDARRGWTLEATLLDAAGVAFNTGRLRGGYAAGKLREAVLCLEDACLDVPCACDVEMAGGLCERCASGDCTSADAELTASGTVRVVCPCREGGFEDDPVLCHDGIDDDCDGAADCDDDDCAGVEEEGGGLCGDGIDNDCDGAVDLEDVADCCTSETAGTSACENGYDDDCDGLFDCEDAGCVGPDENTDLLCGNGFDDDCEDGPDCADGSCCAVAPFACAGRRCGDDASEGLYRWRCCGGACVDVYSDPNNCGGCNLHCHGGQPCRQIPGEQAATCACSIDTDCPSDGIWHCRPGWNGGMCDCGNDTGCAADQTCVNAAADRSQCEYAD